MSQYADLLAIDEMKRHAHEMVMVPRLWSLLTLGETLSWEMFPFTESSRTLVPQEQGVYAFLVVPNIAGNLHVSYLMYIGETDRTLRERFGEYLLEAQSDKIRPKLLRILPLYPNHLMFACAKVSSTIVPKDVETALIEAFLPPGNDQLPASVRRTRRAF